MARNQPEIPVIPTVNVREWITRGIGVSAAVILGNIVLWLLAPSFAGIGAAVLTLLIAGVATFWLRRCFFSVGGETPPRMALVVRWGNVVGSCAPGLHFRWWPFDKIGKFRTSGYTIRYRINRAYSKATETESTQLIPMDVVLSFSWPRPDELYEFSGEQRYGQDLLAQAYYALPFDKENFTIMEQMGPHLSGAVTEAVIDVVAKRSHTECREASRAIEGEVVQYLLEEEGNLFRGLGIPRQLVDFGVTNMEVPTDTQGAMRATEIARHAGEQRRIAARAAAGAASDEAEATRQRLTPYFERGVAAEMAAILVSGGVHGQGMDFAQLRDYMIINAMGGLGGRRERMLTPADFLDRLPELSEAQLQQIEEFLQQRRGQGT